MIFRKCSRFFKKSLRNKKNIHDFETSSCIRNVQEFEQNGHELKKCQDLFKNIQKIKKNVLEFHQLFPKFKKFITSKNVC